MADSFIPIAKPNICSKAKARVMDVLDSGVIASGAEVHAFEEAFASYIGTRAGIASSSGTTALHMALLAAGIGPGDKVITTPFTFIATSNAILYCGAVPVFADVDPATFNLDPGSIRATASKNPDAKAILVVHLFGLSCDMDAVQSIAAEYGMDVIEDCAQAHGAEYHGRRVGSIGSLAAFSFYPTKNMTCGEGGMVMTSEDALAERCRLIVNHGSAVRYCHEILGYNYRMTNIAAAIGICQLEGLEESNTLRIRNAGMLTEGLKGLPAVIVPHAPDRYRHVYNQYTIRVLRDREGLLRHLDACGIGHGLFYPRPSYCQPLYRELGYDSVCCPISEELSEQVLSLPVYPLLAEDDVIRIIEAVRGWAKTGCRVSVSSSQGEGVI